MTRDVKRILYSVAALLLGIAYLVLAASGVLRVSPVHLPAWVGYLVVAGLFIAPAFIMLQPASHLPFRLLALAASFGCALVLPWFYHQMPFVVWVATILLLYLEVYWLLPRIKRRREVHARTGATRKMTTKGATGYRTDAKRFEDPEYVRQLSDEQAERERRFAEFSAILHDDEQTLVEQLNQVGEDVTSVWDLVSKEAPYPSAIPVLVDHLSKPHHPRIREGIVRALAVPEAHAVWPQLVEAFRRERDEGMKAALAIAVGGASGAQDTDELATLAHDEELGTYRVPLIWGLAKSRDPKAGEVLREFRHHPELGAEARKGLRKRKRFLDS